MICRWEINKLDELKKSPCVFLLCTDTLESMVVPILLFTHGSSVDESQRIRTVSSFGFKHLFQPIVLDPVLFEGRCIIDILMVDYKGTRSHTTTIILLSVLVIEIHVCNIKTAAEIVRCVLHIYMYMSMYVHSYIYII